MGFRTISFSTAQSRYDNALPPEGEECRHCGHLVNDEGKCSDYRCHAHEWTLDTIAECECAGDTVYVRSKNYTLGRDYDDDWCVFEVGTGKMEYEEIEEILQHCFVEGMY